MCHHAGVGDKTLQALRTQAQKANLTPGRMLIEMGRNPEAYTGAFPHRALTLLAGFGELLSQMDRRGR